MRVLVWFWSGGGGGSRFAVDLAARLAREPGAEAILSLRGDDPTIARAEAKGLRVLVAPLATGRAIPWRTLIGLPRAAAMLADHIEAAKADMVFLAMNFAAAAPLALAVRKPLVYFAHDPRPHPGDYSPLLQRATQAVLRWRADRVVALSRHGAAQLGACTAVMPLAAVYEPRAAARAAPARPLRLLVLGRLLAYKGLGLLADALAGLERADWRLTVAGAGGGADAALARLRALAGVTVQTGWLSDQAVDALIDAHDILVAPYLSATQSGVVAQAMAAAMPVIATRVGALEEQLAGAGWLAPPTAAALRATIAAALDDAPHYGAHSAATLAVARAAAQADAFRWLAEAGRGR